MTKKVWPQPHWSLINTETNRRVQLVAKDWPVLIHGTHTSGAEFCASVLTAELIRAGQPVVLLSATGENVRTLQHQLDLHRAAATYDQVTSPATAALEEMQLVALFRHRRTDMVTSLRSLKDWGDRIIVVNTIDEVLTGELWAVLKPHSHLVLCGDFEKVKPDIDPEQFRTQMLFSRTPEDWRHQRFNLPTYIGDVYQQKKHFSMIARQVAV